MDYLDREPSSPLGGIVKTRHISSRVRATRAHCTLALQAIPIYDDPDVAGELATARGGPNVDAFIQLLNGFTASVTSLPVSVWINIALAALLLLAAWGTYRLWVHLNETEERVNARLAHTQIKTWEPVANDLEKNAATSAKIAQTSLISHLIILNAAVDAKMRAGDWHKAHELTQNLLAFAVHSISAPYLDEAHVHSCANLITDRLQQYPDLSAAHGELTSDATNFLEGLIRSLSRADAGGRVTQVHACLLEALNRIDPDYAPAQERDAA